MSRCGKTFCKRFRKVRSCLISAVGEERLQKGKHPEQGRHDKNASIAILNVSRMNDGVEQQAYPLVEAAWAGPGQMATSIDKGRDNRSNADEQAAS